MGARVDLKSGFSMKPLAGIRVADFTWVWAGPFCTLQLAHLGAEVIRVESATRPCVTRLLPPWPDGQPGLNRSGYFNQYNQGKLSLALDLKRPEAIEIAKDLVRKSDIVCENFAAGVMERLGLGYDVLRTIRPDLIMISMSGYGATGPEREYVSYGPAQVPLAGLSSLTGYRGYPPMHVGISYGDPTAGLHAAFAVLAALWHREETGEGQLIDLSQWETTISVIPEGIVQYGWDGTQPERNGNRDHCMVPHGIFRCAGEQRWVAIAIRDDAEWERFAAVLDRADLASDPALKTLPGRLQAVDKIEEAVERWTMQRSPREVIAILQSRGIAAFPCYDSRDLAEDEHLRAENFFVELEHPEVGKKLHMGIPWKMSGSPCWVERPAPLLGEHTDYVLRSILGYNEEHIEALRASGVLR
ncbi:MAG: CoA transferase [Candidatus Binatia bacterium]|nr:CoA transferase [Candidatus Binatia bacterium]